MYSARKRERERERDRVFQCERVSLVAGEEREREREREGAIVCFSTVREKIDGKKGLG